MAAPPPSTTGAKIESILIDKTGLGQALRQGLVRQRVNPRQPVSAFSPRYLPSPKSSAISVALEANRFEGTRHNPLRFASPRPCELVVYLVPISKIFVPITHDLVRAASVDEARKTTHQLDEVTECRRCGRP